MSQEREPFPLPGNVLDLAVVSRAASRPIHPAAHSLDPWSRCAGHAVPTGFRFPLCHRQRGASRRVCPQSVGIGSTGPFPRLPSTRRLACSHRQHVVLTRCGHVADGGLWVEQGGSGRCHGDGHDGVASAASPPGPSTAIAETP